jgi:transcriptional regulator with XRE-family HTH domain
MPSRNAVFVQVGNNVQRLREKSGMTIVEAAEKATLNPVLWAGIETGAYDFDLETLANLCGVLAVDAVDLLDLPPKRSRAPRKSSVSASRTTFGASGARSSSRSSKPRRLRVSISGTGTK